MANKILSLIISLDYEIFGNGAGNVMRDIIEPTNRILDICNKNNAKLTIMFEVAEYWAFKQYEKQLTTKLGYSPSKKMEQQAIRAIQQGHDVQLHIHPQWIGAKLCKNELWKLKLDQWGIGFLPNKKQNIEDILSITGALYQGKKTLEQILKPVNENYKCSTFRAGGFLMTPAKVVIQAMIKSNLNIDSSVVKGMVFNTPVELDFSNATNDLGYWWVDSKDVSIEGNTKDTIIECPIYSYMEFYFKNFGITKFFTTIKRSKIEKRDPHSDLNPKEFSSSNFQIKNVFTKLFKKHPMKFDFCKLSEYTMIKYLKKAINRKFKHKKSIPIVMIGHSKDFWNDKNFSNFLNVIKMNKNIEFLTFSEIEQKIYKDC